MHDAEDAQTNHMVDYYRAGRVHMHEVRRERGRALSPGPRHEEAHKLERVEAIVRRQRAVQMSWSLRSGEPWA
jgi:hypothetical protein